MPIFLKVNVTSITVSKENSTKTSTKTQSHAMEHHLHIPSVFKKQTVTQAALLISVLSLVSKFIGFFREVLIANYFGATGQTDAFVVAMMIPGSILGLFAGGFSTLVIPFYLERKSKSEEAARKFVDSALLVWGSVFVVVSAVILILRRPLCT